MAAALQTKALAQAPVDVAPGSITYEDIPYPHPVKTLPLTLYGQDVRMAYMDVPPAGAANGRQIVLLHGMNFGGFYFGGLIEVVAHGWVSCDRAGSDRIRTVIEAGHPL